MASRQAQRRYAYVLSVLAHAAIVAMLTFSIPLTNRNQPVAGSEVAPIETYMIDTAELEAEMARIEAAEEAERLRQQQEAERIRQEQEAQQRELERVQREREAAEQEAERERIRVQQEAEAERLRLAELELERVEAERRAEEERLERERQEEIARQEELERQRQEELARQREEEERRRQEELARQREEDERRRREAVEAEIQRSIAAEQAARDAVDSGLRAQWALAIGRKVEQYWNRPPNVDPNLECVLIVTQLPDGSVTQVTMERCTTNDQTIIRSVENAVLNASPLPPRPNGVPFERQIRITFTPTD